MAGIGFRLQRMLKEDSYTSLVKGYVYSAAISAGPWLFTIAALGFVAVFTPEFLSPEDQALLRGTIIYVYALSLVVTGIYQMVASRHLADRLWLKDTEAILPGYVTLLTGTALTQALLGAGCAYLLGLEPVFAVAAVGLYSVVACLWITIIFLSAAKDYEAITLAFALGCGLSVVGAVSLGRLGGVSGCLYGFMGGQLATLALLLARVFHEFEALRAFDVGILRSFARYSDLALTGFLYNLGIWIDKLVFAYSPLGTDVVPGLRTYPTYEGAMFLAYVTVVPSLALFLIRIETSFYVAYRDFYGAIVAHRSLEDIRLRRDSIAEKLRISVVRLLKLQGAITLVAIALAPQILDAVGFNPLQVLAFRVGALAAFLQVLLLLLLIGLLYFEHRITVMLLSLLFCATNGFFSWLTVGWGIEWHGYGYAASCLVSLVAAYLAFDRAVGQLDFVTFARQPIFPKALDTPEIGKR